MALHWSLLDAQALLRPQNPGSFIRLFCVLSTLLRKWPAFPPSVSSSAKICVPLPAPPHIQHMEPTHLSWTLPTGTESLCSVFPVSCPHLHSSSWLSWKRTAQIPPARTQATEES